MTLIYGSGWLLSISNYLTAREGRLQASIQFAAQDSVGESIVWAAHEQALYWVDIVGKRIHRLEPDSGRHDAWPTPDFPTSIGLRAKGGFIVGLCRDIVFWRPGCAFEPFVIPEPDLPENRLNEGRVAPDGSFWVSTMQNNLTSDGAPRDMTGRSGALYRIDADGRVMQLTPREYGITNTMGWTGGNRFLFADTLQNEIYSFAYDPETKRLSDRRTIVKAFARGLPDGSCMDAEDTLWNCRVVGGASIARFTAQGELLMLVELPVTWPTSCTFGGADLTTLYVTSARFTMTPDHLAANPQEGSLLAIADAGLGVLEPKFAG